MPSAKLMFATIALGLSATAAPAGVHANSLGTIDGLPFFSLPYPYYYVYHRPPAECYDLRPVDTPDGPKTELVWICDHTVRARY